MDRFLTDRVPYLRGGLTDVVGLDDLTDETRLSRRPTAACVLLPDGGKLRVLLGDRELRMPARLTEDVQSPEGKHQVRRGTVVDGRVHFVGGPSSHLLWHYAEATHLVHVPIGTASVEPAT